MYANVDVSVTNKDDRKEIYWENVVFFSCQHLGKVIFALLSC